MQFENLAGIHSPADIRRMTPARLNVIAAEMRAALIHKLSATGGHVGPNLGMVEATIALHYVFDTQTDKLVFDVSHQSYPHKMLTGRMQAFIDPDHYRDVNGYTNPREDADYDLFSVGHTSTAISLATGLAKARDLAGGQENVVAVVGDGSLGGGMALEGLDYGGTLGTKFVVVVNDNDMSIAENHGALYNDLRLLRHSNGTAEPNVFRAFGYDYIYVHYGNDIARLIAAFKAAKASSTPVVVHINTMKGMGLPAAESDKEAFHYSAPFDAATGTVLRRSAAGEAPADYGTLIYEHLLHVLKHDSRLAVLTAGTPGALGFTPKRRSQFGSHFIDVGICEQQAAGMAAGMAKAGARPVFGVVATFLQRAYDQLSHDIALNGLPVVIPVTNTGLYSMNDETHLGFFDIAMISSIPGLLYLAPTCREEVMAMLDWAIKQTALPVAIRIPGGHVVSDSSCELLSDYSAPAYTPIDADSEVAIVGAGTFYGRAVEAVAILAANGVKAVAVNPRSFTYIDPAAVDALKGKRLVVTVEDGVVDGGYGQRLAMELADSPARVVCLGLPKKFENRFDAAKLGKELGLEAQQIATRVLAKLK